MTVFISYRHVDPDQGLADELYRSLIARGHKVFIDTRWTEWAREIQDAIGRVPVLRGAARGRVHPFATIVFPQGEGRGS